MTESRFQVLLLGDFHFGESYTRAGAKVLAEHGYSHSTVHLRPFLQAADVRVVNLETPVVDPERYPSPLRGAKTYIHWADPDGTPAALRDLGIDAVSLANNHTVDHGSDGLLQTLDHLAAADITVFGAGRNLAEARKPCIIEIPAEHGGGRISIHSSFQFSRRHDSEYHFYATDATPGCAPLRRASAQLSSPQDDRFTIAFPHWGANYQWRTERQQDLGRALLAGGHDVVLGHGSHCIQELEQVQGRWIVNSIGNGNFQSGGRFARYGAEGGILPYGFWAMLELSGTGTERSVSLRLYPVHADNAETGYQPRPVGEREIENVASRLADRQPNSPALTTDTDELGHFLQLDLGGWPVGGRPTPAPSPQREVISTVRNGSGHADAASSASTVATGTPAGDAVHGRLYDDPDTRDVLTQYASGRNLGAILNAAAAERAGARIAWMDNSTAVAHFPDRRLLVNGYKCDESDLGSRIVQDKYLLKWFLRRQDVSTPRGELARSAKEAIEIADRLGTPVVVKPRSGNKGRGITVNISTPEEIRAAYDRAAKVGKGLLVEEYVPADREYRVLATADECVSVVRRLLPHVIGDGVATIRELIEVTNSTRTLNPALFKRYTPIDEVTCAYLAKQGHRLDDVLPRGFDLTVRDVGGLSSGGEPVECSDEVDDQLRNTAVQAVRAIPGLTWGGCDIIQTSDGRAYIIEINSDADIGGATYPLQGEPTDIAGRMIALRLASSERRTATVTAPVESAPSRAVRLMRKVFGRSRAPQSADAQPVDPRREVSGPLPQLFQDWLTAAGHRLDREAASVWRVTTPDGATGWMTDEAMTRADLSAVRRVMRRHGLVRRLLAAANVPRVAGRRVTRLAQLSQFAKRHRGALTLIPDRAEWGGRRVRTVTDPSQAGPDVLSGAGTWFVQRRHTGVRLQVFATADRVLAVLGSPNTVLDDVIRTEVDSLAVRAVGTVPQLRWAAVDIVVPTGKDGRLRRPLVEGMTVAPTTVPGTVVLDGALDPLFALIEEGLT